MKDPAVLFYISDWLTSTSEMDSDCKGWYLNLILHNYDKGSLPNDIEKLAVLAGVKFSEFNRFKQMFEQVLTQKFEQIDEQRISNLKAQTILKGRECFKDKRSDAGKKSYLMKFFAKNYTKQYKDKKIYNFVNFNIDTNIDTKNQTEIEHMFKHLFELYINENVNENKDINEDEIKDDNKFDFKKSLLSLNVNESLVNDWMTVRKNKKASNTETALKSFLKQVELSKLSVEKVIEMCIYKSWVGFEAKWITENEQVTPIKNGAKVQTDPKRPAYGKTWDEMTNDEKKANKYIATSPQLIQFNTETGAYEW